jgi:hypothetical protein
VHAPVRRSRGIPLVGRLALGAGVLAVGVMVMYVGAGGLGIVANALGTTISTFVKGVTATPAPENVAPTVPDPPTILSPAEPYTNSSQVDLAVTVPSHLAGDPDHRVRIYLALKDQAPAPIDEKPLAPTPQMIIPVTLTKGVNDFSVTLVGPGGESEKSPLARYVLDNDAPAIRLASPRTAPRSTARPSRCRAGPRAAPRSTPETTGPATRSAGPPRATARSRSACRSMADRTRSS